MSSYSMVGEMGKVAEIDKVARDQLMVIDLI